jgi:hypothetical protein
MKSIWQQIDRFPPILCRLLARVPRGRPLTTEEIATASQLPPAKVEALSISTSWHGVDVYEMKRFMLACHMDIASPAAINRIEDYIRKGAKFSYLRRSKQWEAYYLPLMKKWMESVK